MIPAEWPATGLEAAAACPLNDSEEDQKWQRRRQHPQKKEAVVKPVTDNMSRR
jgi:hypothetical protein